METQTLLIVCFAIGFASTTTIQFEDKSTADFQKISQTAAEECRLANNVGQGEWEKMATKHHIPNDRNIMCMTACYLEKFGSIQPDGKLNWDVIREWNNKEHGPKGSKYVEKCKPKIHAEGVERCQLAKDLLECYFVEGEKIGLFDKKT